MICCGSPPVEGTRQSSALRPGRWETRSTCRRATTWAPSGCPARSYQLARRATVGVDDPDVNRSANLGAVERDRAPSGDHDGDPGRCRVLRVSRRAFDPSAAATQIWTWPERPDANARRRPSGEKCGSVSNDEDGATSSTGSSPLSDRDGSPTRIVRTPAGHALRRLRETRPIHPRSRRARRHDAHRPTSATDGQGPQSPVAT